jgi:hypothetical protein
MPCQVKTKSRAIPVFGVYFFLAIRFGDSNICLDIVKTNNIQQLGKDGLWNFSKDGWYTLV